MLSESNKRKKETLCTSTKLKKCLKLTVKDTTKKCTNKNKSEVSNSNKLQKSVNKLRKIRVLSSESDERSAPTNSQCGTTNNNKEVCDVNNIKSEKSEITQFKDIITAKMTQYNVPTKNQFQQLTDVESDNDEMTVDQQTENSTTKERPPPPIVIHGSCNSHKNLINTIKQSVQSNKFCVKYTRDNINISVENRSERKTLIQQLKANNTAFHTYSDVDEKTHAFVIRGLAEDVTTEELEQHLSSVHNIPVVKCHKMVFNNKETYHYQTKTLFLMVTRSEVTLKKLSNIRYILHTRVYFERRRNTRRISQCHTCQRWGHATSNCHATIICMHCAEKHPTKECPNKGNPKKHKCVNCGKNHAANNTECQAYKDKISWLNNNQSTNVQASQHRQQPHQHRQEDFPPIRYQPAPEPRTNAWKQRAAEQQQSQQTQQQPQSSRGSQQQQPREQQQLQKQQNNTKPTRNPDTYVGKSPIDTFQQITHEFQTLHTLINIDAMLQAIRDLNTTLSTCTSKEQKFIAFTKFTQNINQHDI